jgi:hypothetical protein
MKRVAVVALLLLALAGCAVPGQTLSPGTAYAYDGAEVSNSHIDAIYNAWQQQTKNQFLPNRLQVLTLDAVREPAIALAIEEIPGAEEEFTAERAEQVAKQWFALKQVDAEPSAEVIQSAQGAYAVFVIAYHDADGSLMRRLAEEVQGNVDGSPRSGVFDADAFLNSVYAAMEAAQNEGVDPVVSFIAFHNLNGFVTPATDARVQAPALGATQG